jgi:hypothetical protein
MRDFFKKIFGGKEPEIVSISFDTIPELLSERETAARSLLKAETETPEQNIRNAVANLKIIVHTIAGAEQDPEIHPKLKSIAKNTLPQYIRSMNTALAKEMPEDTEEFYPAAVECVKNCLNSLTGPGRYLQIVFPEEMKASKKGIDSIGHELNALTAALGTYRKEMGTINEAQQMYAAILATNTDLTKAAEKDQRITQRIRETTERIAAIDAELAAMPSDPRMAEADKKKAELLQIEQHRDETARAYAAHSMTASHVFRKAEKIASRQKHPGEITALKHAMFLLSDHELPDADDLEKALVAACPITERMIGAGEITVKNKEERAVFSDSGSFCQEMKRSCIVLHSQEKTCREVQEMLLSHPLLAKAGSLEREKTQLQIMLDKERHTQQDLHDWQKKTKEHIPTITEDLRKKMGGIIGKNVQFQAE